MSKPKKSKSLSRAGRAGGHAKQIIRRASSREDAEHDQAYLDALRPPPVVTSKGEVIA